MPKYHITISKTVEADSLIEASFAFLQFLKSDIDKISTNPKWHNEKDLSTNWEIRR